VFSTHTQTHTRVAEASQICLRDAHALPKWLSYEDFYCRRDNRIDVWLQSIWLRDASNPFVAFYDIHGRNRKVILLFCPRHHTRPGCFLCIIKYVCMYICPTSRIHNTSFVSAYFGLDKREDECLKYLFYLYIIHIHIWIYLFHGCRKRRLKD
jgi:hypothetical protein